MIEKDTRVIYFNIGWMRAYRGTAKDDPTIGGHSFFDEEEHEHGAEAFNFLPAADGMMRGYRPPGNKNRTDISRLGASARDESIDGVLVVWLAREPKSNRTLIVGWYKDARVYRQAVKGTHKLYGEFEFYSAEAKAEDCRLLSPPARTFEIRSSRTAPGEGFGQKPTWYGSPKVDERVRSYIAGIDRKRAAKTGRPASPPRNNDPALRRAVEEAAVDHAVAYFKELYGQSCDVKSVETEAVGWDLEVFCDGGPLLVEVKGLLGDRLVCELTPNEYAKMMMRANRSRYIVFVVNNALAASPASPIASVFEHVKCRIWQTRDGRELGIRETKAAILSAGRSAS
ncbi:MAG: DUF3883 domain-containing protein [Sphingopyxis sp.]|nr:DUF3883 domain-containing protein [Sphingopyxis sp.]